jgi:hypothetical protein
MKLKTFFVVLLLASCGLMATGLGQQGGPGYLDPQRAVTQSLAAVGAVSQFQLASGNSVCSIAVSGTFVGTIQFQQSTDGVNWQPIYVTPNSNGTAINSTTGAFFGAAPMLGSTFFRGYMSAYTSGTALTTTYCVPVKVSLVNLGPFAQPSGSGGGGFPAFTCVGPVTCNPSSGPNVGIAAATPSPGAQGCGFWNGIWPYTLNMSGCALSSQAFTGLVCSGLASCSPSAGPSPAVNVPVPIPSNLGCGVLTIAWPAVNLNTSQCAGGAEYPSLVCSGIATCSPNGGPTPAVYVPSPNPTGSNGCTVTGTWPSQTFSCPTAGPGATPSPTSSGGILISGSYPYTIFASPAVPQSTPSPTVTATACAGSPSASGSYPYTLNIPAGCSGGGVTPAPCATAGQTAGYTCIYAFPVPTTSASIEPGYIGVNAVFLAPAPSPSATANYLAWTAGSGGCGSSQPAGYASLGVNYGNTFFSINGVSGSLATFWCYNTADTPPFLAINAGVGGQRCCVGIYQNVYSQGYDIDAPAFNTGNDGVYWESNQTYGCGFSGHGSASTYTYYFDAYPATPAPNPCVLSISNLAIPAGVTQNKGQLTCTLSTLVCSQTATVISGAICTASYDTAATTVTASLLLPLTVKVVTTTLTISMQGAPTASGTAAADYLCL